MQNSWKLVGESDPVTELCHFDTFRAGIASPVLI